MGRMQDWADDKFEDGTSSFVCHFQLLLFFKNDSVEQSNIGFVLVGFQSFSFYYLLTYLLYYLFFTLFQFTLCFFSLFNGMAPTTSSCICFKIKHKPSWTWYVQFWKTPIYLYSIPIIVNIFQENILVYTRCPCFSAAELDVIYFVFHLKSKTKFFSKNLPPTQESSWILNYETLYDLGHIVAACLCVMWIGRNAANQRGEESEEPWTVRPAGSGRVANCGRRKWIAHRRHWHSKTPFNHLWMQWTKELTMWSDAACVFVCVYECEGASVCNEALLCMCVFLCRSCYSRASGSGRVRGNRRRLKL